MAPARGGDGARADDVPTVAWHAPAPASEIEALLSPASMKISGVPLETSVAKTASTASTTVVEQTTIGRGSAHATGSGAAGAGAGADVRAAAAGGGRADGDGDEAAGGASLVRQALGYSAIPAAGVEQEDSEPSTPRPHAAFWSIVAPVAVWFKPVLPLLPLPPVMALLLLVLLLPVVLLVWLRRRRGTPPSPKREGGTDPIHSLPILAAEADAVPGVDRAIPGTIGGGRDTRTAGPACAPIVAGVAGVAEAEAEGGDDTEVESGTDIIPATPARSPGLATFGTLGGGGWGTAHTPKPRHGWGTPASPTDGLPQPVGSPACRAGTHGSSSAGRTNSEGSGCLGRVNHDPQHNTDGTAASSATSPARVPTKTAGPKCPREGGGGPPPLPAVLPEAAAAVQCPVQPSASGGSEPSALTVPMPDCSEETGNGATRMSTADESIVAASAVAVEQATGGATESGVCATASIDDGRSGDSPATDEESVLSSSIALNAPPLPGVGSAVATCVEPRVPLAAAAGTGLSTSTVGRVSDDLASTATGGKLLGGCATPSLEGSRGGRPTPKEKHKGRRINVRRQAGRDKEAERRAGGGAFSGSMFLEAGRILQRRGPLKNADEQGGTSAVGEDDRGSVQQACVSHGAETARSDDAMMGGDAKAKDDGVKQVCVCLCVCVCVRARSAGAVLHRAGFSKAFWSSGS